MKKRHVEIALIILLVVIMYARPPLLSSFSKSVLGRLLLLVGILAITEKFGINAGMLGAFIMIILINNTKEAQKGKGSAPSKPGGENDAKSGEGDGRGAGNDGVAPNPQPHPVTPDPINAGTTQAETRPGPGGPIGLMLSTDKMAKNRGTPQGGEEDDEIEGFTTQTGIMTLDRRLKENAERGKVAATCPHGGELYGRVFRPF